MAQSDLLQVQSVIGAIRRADAESAASLGGGHAAGIGLGRIEQRRVFHPTPRIEPRQVVHPQPRIEPPAAIFDSLLVQDIKAAENTLTNIQPDPGAVKSHAPEAPWHRLPWKTHGYSVEQPGEEIRTRQVVKLVVHRTDTHSKGTMIDFFC